MVNKRGEVESAEGEVWMWIREIFPHRAGAGPNDRGAQMMRTRNTYLVQRNLLGQRAGPLRRDDLVKHPVPDVCKRREHAPPRREAPEARKVDGILLLELLAHKVAEPEERRRRERLDNDGGALWVRRRDESEWEVGRVRLCAVCVCVCVQQMQRWPTGG